MRDGSCDEPRCGGGLTIDGGALRLGGQLGRRLLRCGLALASRLLREPALLALGDFGCDLRFGYELLLAEPPVLLSEDGARVAQLIEAAVLFDALVDVPLSIRPFLHVRGGRPRELRSHVEPVRVSHFLRGARFPLRLRGLRGGDDGAAVVLLIGIVHGNSDVWGGG